MIKRKVTDGAAIEQSIGAEDERRKARGELPRIWGVLGDFATR